MRKRSSKKRPTDANALAAQIVAEATGEASPPVRAKKKNAAAVALGRKGGLKGGKARKEALSPERRREIAHRAAMARWKTED